MVRQFADPYAFLRELVQNSVDAGATRIDVTVELAGGQTAYTRVADDGSGMTRSVLENNLCTLFASTKEGDASKVGKYGVGFVSVLAVEPDQVVVETWRAEASLVLTLQRDHSWELQTGIEQTGSGTRVTLVHSMDRDAFGRHADQVVASLRRWCRHVRVPVQVATLDQGNPSANANQRINAPFSVFSPLVVSHQDELGEYVVGCAAGSDYLDPDEHTSPAELDDRFAGFYNRGLTLYETDEERFAGLDGVRFKVASAAFAHTLSRDNVRRDAQFDRALARVRKLVRNELRRELIEQLAAAAQDVDASPKRYLALLAAAQKPPLGLRPTEMTLALTDPIDGRRAVPLEQLAWATPWTEPVVVAEQSSPLTKVLSARGRPVLWDGGGRVVELVADALRAHRLLSGVTHTRADSLFTLVAPAAQAEPGDAELCDAVRQALAVAGTPCARVIVVRTSGRPQVPASFVLEGSGPWILEVGGRAARPSRRATVALDAAHPPVQRARQVPADRVPLAAQLLARLVLVELGSPPSADENEALLRALAGEPS